jgi:hypothetical protein
VVEKRQESGVSFECIMCDRAIIGQNLRENNARSLSGFVGNSNGTYPHWPEGKSRDHRARPSLVSQRNLLLSWRICTVYFKKLTQLFQLRNDALN